MTQATTGWFSSLAVRLLIFLSVALIPIGLLAVMQTGDIVRRAENRADAALAGLTRDAAVAEREIIQRAFGIAMGLAPFARASWDTEDECAQGLSELIEQQEMAVTAGFIRSDGEMWCASTGETFDFSDYPGWSDNVAAREPTVNVNPRAPISKRPVVTVSQPFTRNGAFAGFVFVSVPHESLALGRSIVDGSGLTVVTFTSGGEILTAMGHEESNPAGVLPVSRSLEDLGSGPVVQFRDTSVSGDPRSYSVSPILDGTVYALGTWVPTPHGATGPFSIKPEFFPIIMWLTSLGVAFATVYRLVMRHLSKLRRQMRAFAKTRRLPDPSNDRDVSGEIRELQQSFADMAETVLHDEAEMEQLVHDKNVLLKEVHHRVKNNLQLISSIMNMQMRELKSREAKAVVRRLQERVLGLATIHRNLYRTENLSKVNAPQMLTELTDQILALADAGQGSFDVDRKFADINLYPDQAVPLSLLVAEATTNSMKYLGTGTGRWVRMRLTVVDETQILLEITNSKPESESDLAPHTADQGTGLGTNLMRAFALQLGGQLDFEDQPDQFSVRIVFTWLGFDAEDQDAQEAA
ncbi:sensor histidine kinase [Meridianimarinicoccus aquatilis]|uniref:histidine kinase n=1 Tax=Meridianimarinicoccus aquatilis TaxID=2552766 RepID=A0A4R6ASE3_9RHOB|nr:histidine kinase dimerization/phosphoacceptor domain -containing protein [Fluviibacterium aquatile]TDL87070.1 sensor histidine kinase [Fluviibacterium aquatile]